MDNEQEGHKEEIMFKDKRVTGKDICESFSICFLDSRYQRDIRGNKK